MQTRATTIIDKYLQFHLYVELMKQAVFLATISKHVAFYLSNLQTDLYVALSQLANSQKHEPIIYNVSLFIDVM